MLTLDLHGPWVSFVKGGGEWQPFWDRLQGDDAR